MKKKIAFSLALIFVLFQCISSAADRAKGKYDPYLPGYPDGMSGWGPGLGPSYSLPFSFVKGKDYYSTGTLVLQVAPEGVDVRLDGISIHMPGASGATVEIPVRRGFHTLDFSKEGYASHEETFTILPFRRVTIAQTLSKEAEGAKAAAAKTEKTQPAFLELDVAPPQASVSLGTIQAGTGESLRAQGKVPVLPGNYELFVSLPGYKPYIENVQLEAGQVLSKRIRLEPLVPAEAR